MFEYESCVRTISPRAVLGVAYFKGRNGERAGLVFLAEQGESVVMFSGTVSHAQTVDLTR
jgi:hypothetical protein